jgi:hypothetical protein
MEFKKDKYFGEIWFPNKENEKQFCTIEIIENKVCLHTNLYSIESSYRVSILYGKFNDLGFVTFANCKIRNSVSSIIEYKEYLPTYLFVSSDEYINPYKLRLKSIEIENETINELIRPFHIMNPLSQKVEIKSVKTHEIKLNDDLTLSFHKNYGISSNILKTTINNYGVLKIDFNKEKSVLESIEIYKQFQKFCIVFFSGIKKYKYFKSKCLNCGNKFNILFDDNLAINHHQGFFDDDLLSDHEQFSTVIANWFNNENLKYCFDIIIENYLSVKVSNARRFVNSIATFEAFYKFISLKKHEELDKRIIDFEDDFISIDNEIVDFTEFSKRIVRFRNIYIHSNKNDKIKHDNFELLYLSLLFDHVIILKLSENLGFNSDFIEKIKKNSIEIFKYQMPLNRNLNSVNIID